MIISTVIQKVVNFSMNQMIIRKVGPEIFGLAAIQFELLLSTLLFISR